MPTEQPRYLAYMLRLWEVSDNGEMIWRASLENPHTGERRGFADLDALFAFLAVEVWGTSKISIEQPPADLSDDVDSG